MRMRRKWRRKTKHEKEKKNKNTKWRMTKIIRCYKVKWPKNMSRTLISKALFLLSPLRSFLSSWVENSYNHIQHSNNKLMEIIIIKIKSKSIYQINW
jgi:hypothetical protein